MGSASPELAARIAEWRERGSSLQAIARELNDQGVPTRRGGSRWRPSSVRSALGDFSGFAVSRHWMSFWLAVLAATAGTVADSLIAYGIGATR